MGKINANVSVKCDVAELQRLNPEQLDAFMGSVAQVLSAGRWTATPDGLHEISSSGGGQ